MKKVFFIKKEFTCEFCEISKNIFFIEHLWATASVFIKPVAKTVLLFPGTTKIQVTFK